MRALIVAAGRGSRLGELTSSCPKALVSLAGAPLIEYSLAALARAGVDEIALVTGYRGEMLRAYSPTQFHNRKWRTTNMVTSMMSARDWLKGQNSLVIYSDIFFEASAISRLMEQASDIVIPYDVNWREHWAHRFENPLADLETFRISTSGHVTEIGNKPHELGEIQGQFMGIIGFSPSGWQHWERAYRRLGSSERRQISTTELLNLVLQKEPLAVRGEPFSGIWGEIDSPSDLAVYEGIDHIEDLLLK